MTATQEAKERLRAAVRLMASIESVGAMVSVADLDLIVASHDALEAALAKANKPTHFWASTDGEYGEICVDIESAIEAAVYEAPRGRHLVEVDAWRRCQPIWAVVHLLTDEEQEALGVDTDWTILKCATEAEARAVLKEADQVTGPALGGDPE
jgi:hypothetical protein